MSWGATGLPHAGHVAAVMTSDTKRRCCRRALDTRADSPTSRYSTPFSASRSAVDGSNRGEEDRFRLELAQPVVDRHREDHLRRPLQLGVDGLAPEPSRVLVRIPATAEVEMVLPDAVKVEASDAFVDRVESIFGTRTVRFA